jgi:sec-independent protein translocase protein TatA
MALVGSELLIAVGVLLVVFLWGPQKLPELARSVGLAKKEFDKAAKEVTSTAPPPVTVSPSPNTGTDALVVAANSLGIVTQGKTRDEIAREIRAVPANN